MTHIARFLSRIAKESNGCWRWTGARNEKGYGQFRFPGGCRAHRFAYIAFVGPISEGMEIDHMCGNTGCVNPAHLDEVTPLENARRRGLRITHCPAGHAYTSDNLRNRAGRGKECRACHRANNARSHTTRGVRL